MPDGGGPCAAARGRRGRGCRLRLRHRGRGSCRRACPASAVVVLDGEAAADLARRWTAGSILWINRSPLRPGHARKNWFVGVVMLPEAVANGAAAPARADIRFESFRAGGPGGQHQNKTESAVRAVHGPTGLTATARDGRSQHRNKVLAVERLTALLDARARLAHDGDARLIHAAHRHVERGAAGLRFVGPDFRPAEC